MVNHEDRQLLLSIDRRLGSVEESISVINRELGILCGKVGTNNRALLIKFVIFPLILIIGGLIGIDIFIPF